LGAKCPLSKINFIILFFKDKLKSNFGFDSINKAIFDIKETLWPEYHYLLLNTEFKFDAILTGFEFFASSSGNIIIKVF